MDFKFIYQVERSGDLEGDESTGKYQLIRSKPKEISKQQVIKLLKKENEYIFVSFKGFDICYKNHKFYYGRKKFDDFDSLLSHIAKKSKKDQITIKISRNMG